MESQLRHLLAQRPVASLATLGPDGLPHVVPMWVYAEDDHVYIPTSSTTVKTRNLRRDDRAAVMVHEVHGPMDVRGALLQGRVRIIEGAEAGTRNRVIHEHYLSAEELGHPAVSEYLSHDDITLELRPGQIRTWDLSHLVGRGFDDSV